jgi:FMN reductase
MHRALGDAVERANSGPSTSGAKWSLLDLALFRIGFADGTTIDQLEDDTAILVEQIRSAAGVILASPVYRASLTGALKNSLDLLPVDALQAKPVGLLAMGGSDHHFLGVASHLRDVLGWFGALLAPTDVYLTGADFSDGIPTPSAATDLDVLFATVATIAHSLRGTDIGPIPLAARY